MTTSASRSSTRAELTAPVATHTREVRLARRPHGEPSLDDFALAEVPVPVRRPGQLLVRNTWMSVDPYMRGRMDDRDSYLPPFQLGSVLEGSALGEVLGSDDPAFPVGSTVVHFAGWRDHAVIDAVTATRVDVEHITPQMYLGPLGTTGLTAHLALTESAPVRRGDTVLVSSAAGAVGSVAGQLARALGAGRVIGSAGGPDKVALLRDELGFDAAIDHRLGDLPGQVAAAAPDGVDVYVDLVGGPMLEAVLGTMNANGRIAAVGAVSEYNAVEPPPGPRNLYTIATKRLSVRGLLVTDHLDRFPAWFAVAVPLLEAGTLVTLETVRHGLDSAPQALIDLLAGRSRGKMLVALAS
ncbi:MAG: NADP-dependent oxidoreductase [Intrasporangium sp.]|nr:NADP-dependent oxidoreductase [Intrasporangium sp.]MDV3222161.1 NADP-dependent oxidoreductase [Intrasporangium sp.]